MKYFDQLLDILRNARTEDLLQFFKESEISELMHSPYFLGVVAIILLICLIMKWRLLLATTIGIVGFAELLAYTTTHDTTMADGLGNESLVVFIGGGTAIVSIVIYVLFIKSE